MNKILIFTWIFIPLIILILGLKYILIYPVDFPIQDEIFLMMDIHENNSILSWDEMWRNKNGTKWPLYKLFFSIAINSGINKEYFLISGFLSNIIIAYSIFFFLKKEKIKINSVFLIFLSIIFFLRPSNIYLYHYSLAAFRQFEIILIFSLSLFCIYFFKKEKYIKFYSFSILLAVLSSTMALGFNVAVMLALCFVLLICFEFKRGLISKIFFCILTYLVFEIISSGISVKQLSIFDLINLWKNLSTLIYFFINPLLDWVNLWEKKNENSVESLILGIIIFVPLSWYILKNCKKDFFHILGFFCFLCIIFCSAILYVGEYNFFYKAQNLADVRIAVKHRFPYFGPFSILTIGFVLLIFSYAGLPKIKFLKTTNYSKFYFNIIKISVIFLLVYFSTDGFLKFKKRLKDKSFLTEAIYLDDENKPKIRIMGKYTDYYKVPCYKRIAYWNSALPSEICEKFILDFNQYRTKKRKIKITFFK